MSSRSSMPIVSMSVFTVAPAGTAYGCGPSAPFGRKRRRSAKKMTFTVIDSDGGSGASVEVDRGARDPLRALGPEERHEVRELLRFAEPAERHVPVLRHLRVERVDIAAFEPSGPLRALH